MEPITMMIMTLVMINGTVDEEATIRAAFYTEWENTEYEFNYWLKPPSLFELTRKGDCTDVAYAVQRKMFKQNITTRRMYGMAECNGKRSLHDWLIWNNTDIDGGCKNFERGATI